MLPSPSAQAGFREVPFGDKVSEAIVNYNRTTPHVATAGLVLDGGIEELKALGFKAVLDLRSPPEGTADEDAAAGRAGLGYVNIPISKSPPTKEQIRTFAAVVDDPPTTHYWSTVFRPIGREPCGPFTGFRRAFPSRSP